MDITELQARGRQVRRRYDEETTRRYGRTWTPEEFMLGFVGDVGDLAKLVQGKAGVRDCPGLDEAVAHELADCLWSVFTLADCYDVDLAAAFTAAMADIDAHLDSVGADQPLG
ncbi:nucleotide pyrophosphohydrolase [Nocardioides sp. KIGAM211]|uniref:Nucleotide pyrophosphohydrolase n=1 Tax=Nocardioides luti TaxID=2761101 RepID=A0A7X0RLS4_9ACTN|nr:nucleotide pyrophosphohydrolase [Nocardioides luti]MBB6629333.1 nucleotide pyrophosphohydrolase [Nocardioides luti]